MKIALVEDYVYTTKLDLNLVTITDSCYQMYDYIKHNFSDKPKDYSGQSTMTTGVYAHYNVLLYPLREFHSLYENIKMMFHAINDRPDEKFYMQCWLNFYRKGEFIDWHAHWPPEAKSWHGFYCVSGKGSCTTYKLPPDHKKEVEIPTILNQIVISKSDGDLHRSSDWQEDYPRITIAFDIVPISYLKNPFAQMNHWIPI
jgi:hypothetical protein